jgi:hypothetical protein
LRQACQRAPTFLAPAESRPRGMLHRECESVLRDFLARRAARFRWPAAATFRLAPRQARGAARGKNV